MMAIIEFFVAPDDEAAAKASVDGPNPAFEPLEYEGLFPIAAVLEWEIYLTGASRKELDDRAEPRVVADVSAEAWQVFALSEPLCAALASADPAVLRDLARYWSDLEQSTEDEDAISTFTANHMLTAVAGLARRVAEQGHGRVYCWWG